jgi:hypothetical protein
MSDLTPASADFEKRVKEAMRGFRWPEIGDKILLKDGPAVGIFVMYSGGTSIELPVLEHWGKYTAHYGLDGIFWETTKSE